MKLIGWLFTLWLFVAIAIGWTGDWWLHRQWQAVTQLQFVRDVQLAWMSLSAQTWQSPVESDPKWKDLEVRTGINIVPIPLPLNASSTLDPLTSSIGDVQLVLHGQRFQLSAQATRPVPGLSTDLGLQFTREIAPSTHRRWWWIVWSLSNGSYLLFVWFGWSTIKQRSERERNSIAPWVAAAKLPVSHDDLLPPVAEFDSELEPALKLIAERVNRTVAELRNSNQRSDLVLGNLQEGVLAVDQNSAVLLANSSLRDLFELQEQTVINRPLLEVVRIPLVTQLIDRVLLQQVPHEEGIEFGSPAKHLRLLARPLRLDQQHRGVLLTVRDETLLKRIELIRRDFVANASHELKTPLAAIRAYAETLQMGALDDRPAAEQFVNDIISQADRINGLVQGMLQLSRVQSGTALRLEPFDVMEAIEPCLPAIESMAKGKGITLTVERPADRLTIHSDRAGFQTIVSNLLSNAVRYTPDQGQATLAFKLEGNWLALVVSDTGIGIQREDLERIFERFYRAEKGRSADTGGTGLGLAIVKNLVQALGGLVSASSEPNCGSRFEVRLPVRPL